MGGGDKMPAAAGRPAGARACDRAAPAAGLRLWRLNANGDAARFGASDSKWWRMMRRISPGRSPASSALDWGRRTHPSAAGRADRAGGYAVPAARPGGAIGRGGCARDRPQRRTVHPVVGLWPLEVAADLRAALRARRLAQGRGLDRAAQRPPLWISRRRPSTLASTSTRRRISPGPRRCYENGLSGSAAISATRSIRISTFPSALEIDGDARPVTDWTWPRPSRGGRDGARRRRVSENSDIRFGSRIRDRVLTLTLGQVYSGRPGPNR